MKIMHALRTSLRHLPGLLLLIAAIALFDGALSVALAHERDALRAEPQSIPLMRQAYSANMKIEGSNSETTLPMRYPTAQVSPAVIKPIDIPHARMVYYTIAGNTPADLRKQMNLLGPTDPHGAHSDAYTDWYVSWVWPGYGSANCDLSQVRISYAITVTFPKWEPANSVSQAKSGLVDQWQHYITRLALHEKGHVDDVVKNQRAIRQSIERATCSTADAAAQRALERLRTFGVNYDKKTRHGATQGATFP